MGLMADIFQFKFYHIKTGHARLAIDLTVFTPSLRLEAISFSENNKYLQVFSLNEVFLFISAVCY